MRRDPVQARSRETVERILDAAAELIAEAGVDATTTRTIADRAGVSAAALYRFFENRDQILDRLLQRDLVRLDDHLQAGEEGWVPGDVAELIHRELSLYCEYFERSPSVVALWFGARISDTVVAQVRERNLRVARRLQELCEAAGLVAGVDLAAFAVLVELGDRVLELAFRDRRKADPGTLALGEQALAAYLGTLA